MSRLLSPLGWLAVGMSAIVVLFFAGLIFTGTRHKTDAAVARGGRIVAEGQAAAGHDAIGVVSGNASSEVQIDKQTQVNRDEILSQPGANAPVDPAVGSAGRRTICLRKSARDLPACKRLLDPGS